MFSPSAPAVVVVPQRNPEEDRKNISSGEDVILPDDWDDPTMRSRIMGWVMGYEPEQQVAVA